MPIVGDFQAFLIDPGITAPSEGKATLERLRRPALRKTAKRNAASYQLNEIPVAFIPAGEPVNWAGPTSVLFGLSVHVEFHASV
jgi:hypothetical protein